MSYGKRVSQRVIGAVCVGAIFVGLLPISDDASAQAVTGIRNTRHNLGSTNNVPTSATSPVPNFVQDTADICVFCHTPHGANVRDAQGAPLADAPPLWNKSFGGGAAGYTTYASLNSATIDGEILPVGSTSIACLSCHDGTQAMDNMINAPGSGPGNAANPATGANYTWNPAAVTANRVTAAGALGTASTANLGTDLSNDHPIGIQYCGGFANGTTGACRDPDFVTPQNTGTAYYVETAASPGAPATAVAGSRDKHDMVLFNRQFAAGLLPSVECGTCHDPHAEPFQAGAGQVQQVGFLRVSNAGSALCLACHTK